MVRGGVQNFGKDRDPRCVAKSDKTIDTGSEVPADGAVNIFESISSLHLR
jgi:hypothetical protein